MMFSWNPFRKEQPTQNAPAANVSLPENPELLNAIVTAREGSGMQDLRPLHRAILRAQLLLPLHEPPRQTPQGSVLRYMTFENDTVMCAFTDEARLRTYFGRGPNDDPVYIAPSDGQTVCRMATHAELAKIIINPNADILYAMHPLVYKVLAQGLVPGTLAAPSITANQVSVVPPFMGMPSESAVQAFRQTLKAHGAQSAVWFALILADQEEMRYGLGLECTREEFAGLESKLCLDWINVWPVHTPLYLHGLDNAPVSQAIRENGVSIFP